MKFSKLLQKALLIVGCLSGLTVAIADSEEALPTYNWLTPDGVAYRFTDQVTDQCETHLDIINGGVERLLTTEQAGYEQRLLENISVGNTALQLKPQYWLGDEIVAPENVNWLATEVDYLKKCAENKDYKDAFLFDATAQKLYAAMGGTYSFSWRLSTGESSEITYIIASGSKTRPYRIFWTDAPYNSPSVSLSGKFVKFYGTSSVLNIERGTVTNVTSGIQQEITNAVIKGLYLDETTQSLQAIGGITGQVLLAYYDTGTYENLKAVQVIEVSRPIVTEMKGIIGQALSPSGDGYSIERLKGYPQGTSIPVDNRGDYYYQHVGQYSYSPKYGNIYPLRPTVGESWRLPVYWKEADKFDTEWMFELCHYDCDWASETQLFVRGKTDKNYGVPIYFSSNYTVELQKFQEPEGHARAVDLQTNSFSTVGEGYALLKISGNDNVWFLPIHSVFDTNPIFNQTRHDWPVGKEILPCEAATDLASSITDNPIPYLYKPNSGTFYNPEIYTDPQPLNALTTEETKTYPSVLYAVNVTEADGTESPKPLEVWWMDSVIMENMSDPILVPSIAQYYTPTWPKEYTNPSIAIAAQKGSANASSVSESGMSALVTNETASVTLPAGTFFKSTQQAATLALWLSGPESVDVSTENTDSKRLLTLSSETLTFQLSYVVSARKYQATVKSGEKIVAIAESNTIDSPKNWQGIVVDFGMNDGHLQFRLGIFDVGAIAMKWGEPIRLSDSTISATFFDANFTTNTLGAVGTSAPTSQRFCFGAARILLGAANDENVTSLLLGKKTAVNSASVTLDAQMTMDVSKRYLFVDRVSGQQSLFTGITDYKLLPPIEKTGILTDVASGTMPQIYVQNDLTQPGFNPNEEHAILKAGAGGYVAWPLRCDLNEPVGSRQIPYSKCGVLVSYINSAQRPAMQWYDVTLRSNNDGQGKILGTTAEVGTMVSGPHPLESLDTPWLTSDYWTGDGDDSIIYRDRKGQLWFRRDGTCNSFMYYAMQEGFFFPTLGVQPEVGTEIPWLAGLEYKDGEIKPTTVNANILNADPLPWQWTVTWPKSVPTMKIGQTITKAANGLPEVWAAKSVSILYPVNGDKRVKLYDPTVARHPNPASKVFNNKSTMSNLIKDLGLDISSTGNAYLRNGKYYFRNVPPTIGERFYLDTAASSTDGSSDLSQAFTLVGSLEQPVTGDPIVYVNVLDAEEKAQLKALAISSDEETTWKAMIDAFSTNAIEPNSMKFEVQPAIAAKAKINDLKTTYTAVDHYALTSMGGAGYVTWIENDAPVNGANGIAEGDPIQMHVIKVVPEYYTGSVIARQDPTNLLSQQLSILYTESFGGNADEFEFEWKKATPSSNGSMPTDYAGYQSVFEPSLWAGKTRFILGKEGDTLADMVNTYYVVRYRAKEGNSAVYKTMGDKWSDWCGPTLAEGWIQRVFNNITPFTQRMQDLYENKSETLTTMIQEAGGPYQGDVALNQDNLTNVGLIQLYMTLLNKAESMSLKLGVNNEDANKQLILAAERLADMYIVLGNEAYVDALNPTIGFGSNAELTSDGLCNVNYGALSTSLFCFDNVEPTLLDEELALLRGRSVQTVAPVYNRLLWNFSKGITAGEVAYVNNYNINMDPDLTDAVIDEEDAKRFYPQGHGDAWGHYLSGLKVFYRLLRNPNFSWSTSMGEMLIADTVANVDYYDEERFAEIAAKLAKTAALIVDRTARKAWRDNVGASASGYLDSNKTRNFGYGEWGSKAGISTIANWMVANSLLPESVAESIYYRPRLSDKAAICIYQLAEACSIKLDRESWTLEFQISDVQLSDKEGVEQKNAELVTLIGENFEQIGVELHQDRKLYLVWYSYSSEMTEKIVKKLVPLCDLPEGITLIALDHQCDVTKDDTTVRDNGSLYRVRCLNREGALIGENSILLPATVSAPNENANFVFGGGFSGYISEIRFWDDTVALDSLRSTQLYVNPHAQGLLASLRIISETDPGMIKTLKDETNDALLWVILSPSEDGWTKFIKNGSEIDFSDSGISRIDRTSVTSLKTLVTETSHIEDVITRLDSGMNPLGFSQDAIPFDITPIGVESGESTHFEQIYARACTALKNAKTVLDKAQTIANQLRLLQESQNYNEQEYADQELDFKNQLIAIYGTPYSGDIGPGKTYEQGYSGPDVAHYMWMDLKTWGLTEVPSMTNALCTVQFEAPQMGSHYYDSSSPSEKPNSQITYTYLLQADGLIQKDLTVTGSRTTQGSLQRAYADYLTAYCTYKEAFATYDAKTERMKDDIARLTSVLSMKHDAYALLQTVNAFESEKLALNTVLDFSINNLKLAADTVTDITQAQIKSTPRIIGAGLTVNADPGALANLVLGEVELAVTTPLKVATTTMENIELINASVIKIFELTQEFLSAKATYFADRDGIISQVKDAISNQVAAGYALREAYLSAVEKAEAIKTQMVEGEKVYTALQAARAAATDVFSRQRYQDMFFRLAQNEALTRYDASFTLAQQYVFLAAQAYDYETGLLSADKVSGNAFRAEIIGARTLGEFDSNDAPTFAGSEAAPGLSDILARMNANWLVLKGRLGINNAQKDTTWFSLRTELLRIKPDESGDAAWRNALASYWVKDIKAYTGFVHFCEPFTSASDSKAEPGLIIPFSTTIDFAKNFFGKTLAGGDSTFDPTYFATKISGAGIQFVDYNKNTDGSDASAPFLAKTPVVYLIPYGKDVMRVPGADKAESNMFNVVDQVVPLPYIIGSSELDDPDWTPVYSGNTGGADLGSLIRRYPSFRAIINGTDSEDALRATRLIGRSVWNTQWVLFIPAGSMNADREAALNAFIYGVDTDRDGKPDIKGISDIKIGFRTYSNAGN